MNQIKFTPHSNRATFSESWQAFEDGEAITLTGATIVFSARDPDTNDEVLSGTTAGGEITISTTTFTLAFSVDDVSSLEEKEYKVGCTIEIDDVVTQFFVGTLPIVDGVVP